MASVGHGLTSSTLFAGILATEAYHAGYIRTALIQNGDVVTPYGVNVTTIVNAISAARDTLDGTATVDDGGIFDANTGELILTPTDANAITYTRTPQMVLDIVYLSPTAAPGGFFPNRLSGTIH